MIKNILQDEIHTIFYFTIFVLSSNAHRIYLKDDFVTQYFIVGKLRLKSILILQNLET